MQSEIASQIDPARVLRWINGRPAELWLSHQRLAEQLVKEHKLKPLRVEDYPYIPLAAELGASFIPVAKEASRAAIKWRWPIPFPGGMRIPHLHVGPNVYVLDAVQWKAFSKAVVADIQDRLARASEVGIGFEDMLELGEVGASLQR